MTKQKDMDARQGRSLDDNVHGTTPMCIQSFHGRTVRRGNEADLALWKKNDGESLARGVSSVSLCKET